MSDLLNDPCAGEITAGFLFDCDAPPIAGIEQKLVLINVEDVTSIVDAVAPLNKSQITDIILAATKTGYEVQGVKQVLNFTNSLDAPETSSNGVIHSLSLRVFTPSVEARAEINNFIQGSKVFAVVERKNKGTDKVDAFLFFGQRHGLILSELTDDANENDGTIGLVLSTPPGLREPFLPKVYLDTDYATSKTAFDNLFEAAGP